MITATDMNIYVKLSNIQNELKAPKGQYNSFGKYKYRSCEDILEAVKPICYKYKATLVLSDDVVNIGDRIYVLARATLYDQESDAMVENRAFARESLEKKGMDESQITGTASSYARKYALNGLFNIDDTKDADTDEYKEQQEYERKAEVKGEELADTTKVTAMAQFIENNNIDRKRVAGILASHGYAVLTEIKLKDYQAIGLELKKLLKEN